MGDDNYSGKNQDMPGSDGIGDIPCTNIDGGAGAKDNYPFVNKSGWLAPVNALSIAQIQTDKIIYASNENVTISCTVQKALGQNYSICSPMISQSSSVSSTTRT